MIIGRPGILSKDAIDTYHIKYYQEIGLPASTYGGAGIPNWIGRLLYCSECD